MDPATQVGKSKQDRIREEAEPTREFHPDRLSALKGSLELPRILPYVANARADS